MGVKIVRGHFATCEVCLGLKGLGLKLYTSDVIYIVLRIILVYCISIVDVSFDAA